MLKQGCLLLLLVLPFSCLSCNGTLNGTSKGSAASANAAWKNWTEKPPMGWNSWDCYFGCITEPQYRKCVDVLADKMLPYGYEYAVIDMGWYHPGPADWDLVTPKKFDVKYEGFNEKTGRWEPELAMDEYGRFLPSTDRFPSAAQGNGFKALADYTHQRGLKFGIHIMRGVPRQAVLDKKPVLGTNVTCADIASREDFGHWWNNYMFGIDHTQPGAQAYYNSLFDLYASWGVDYVKVDDIMVPKYHKHEIEMIRRAIDQCGRPIVLSLSCGEAQASWAPHLETNANLYRISIDVWDRWRDLCRVLDLSHYWSPFIGNGTWPDNDMLCIGRLCVGGTPGDTKWGPRDSKLSAIEQQSMMTLWAIARSPLMWGGDPLTTPEEDLTVLRNPEILAVNQHSTNNRQSWFEYGDGPLHRIWYAEVSDSADRYIALLNFSDDPSTLKFELRREYMRGKYRVRDLWTQKDLGLYEGLFWQQLPAHGSGLYRFTPVSEEAGPVLTYDGPYSFQPAQGSYTLHSAGHTLSGLKSLVNEYNVIQGGRDWYDGRYTSRLPGADVELKFETVNDKWIRIHPTIENTRDESFTLKRFVIAQGNLPTLNSPGTLGFARAGAAISQSTIGKGTHLTSNQVAGLFKGSTTQAWIIGFGPKANGPNKITVNGNNNQFEIAIDYSSNPKVIPPGETLELDSVNLSAALSLLEGFREHNKLQ